MSDGAASLTRYAWLSIGAALATIALKSLAYWLTGSVGLLSDALESIVNLVAAVVALVVLRVAESPADEEHAYGHEKVEYFSSGLEGALIVAAAVAILLTAVPRFWAPTELTSLGLGAVISAGASLINLATARVLLAAAKKHGSIVLEADGHHLMTDVWTSFAVIAGVALVEVTGLAWLDPLVAVIMAVNIARMAWSLLYRSGMGLLDTAVPEAERAAIDVALAIFREEGIKFHALKTRQAGTRSFVSVHVLVPGRWTVQRGHDLCERVEAAIRATSSKTTVMTHLEPVEDPRSYEDQGLDRDESSTGSERPGPAPEAPSGATGSTSS